MRAKRLTATIIQDSDGTVIFKTTGAAEEFSGYDLFDVPEYKYIDRIAHEPVVIFLDPEGKLLMMYDIDTGERYPDRA
jgi:hypothetical protein